MAFVGGSVLAWGGWPKASVQGPRMLAALVFDEVLREPLDHVAGVVQVGRRRRHLLQTNPALGPDGTHSSIVCEGNLRSHFGSPRARIVTCVRAERCANSHTRWKALSVCG